MGNFLFPFLLYPFGAYMTQSLINVEVKKDGSGAKLYIPKALILNGQFVIGEILPLVECHKMTKEVKK